MSNPTKNDKGAGSFWDDGWNWIELRTIAERLHMALSDLVGGEPGGIERARAVLREFPRCVACGHLEAGHEALHRFTPPTVV